MCTNARNSKYVDVNVNNEMEECLHYIKDNYFFDVWSLHFTIQNHCHHLSWTWLTEVSCLQITILVDLETISQMIILLSIACKSPFCTNFLCIDLSLDTYKIKAENVHFGWLRLPILNVAWFVSSIHNPKVAKNLFFVILSWFIPSLRLNIPEVIKSKSFLF